MIPRLVVAGTHSGVGKTTVATGLMAAFAARGLRVAGFKVGPDFIDPSYHALATSRPGRNLDAFLSGTELIAPLFSHGSMTCDLAIVEGVMGLYDGAAGRGELASTAQVAKLLDAPVLLIVDARAMARSAAALVHGYASFDRGVRIAGVVLNRVGSEGHERMLREALASLGVTVLGVLRRDERLSNPERHLGLVPVAERRAEASRQIGTLAEVIARTCDLDAVLRTARAAPRLTVPPWDPSPVARTASGVRIAIAAGPAFTFLYEENLELLLARGADPAPFDPTRDAALPEGSDALLVGGGFPETYGEALSANEPLRRAVRAFAAAGKPVVGECGGLLFLCRSLDGRSMCGLVDADAVMTDRLTLGYRSATALADSPIASRGAGVRAHEFHYSTVRPRAGTTAAWDIAGLPEGFVAGRIHASYLHTHWAAFSEIADRLVREAASSREAVPA